MSHSFQSDSIAALAKALAKAQPNIKEPVKDKKGNFGAYASLASLRQAVLPHLNAVDIAVTQLLWSEGDEYLETKLLHGSGEWISSRMKLKIDKPSMQAYGSAITYACRYSLQALAGSGGEEDDDGQESEKFPQSSKPSLTSPQRSSSSEPPSKAPSGVYDPTFVMPFGYAEVKGKPLHEIGEAQVRKSIEWVEKNQKSGGFYDVFAANAKAYLASLQNPKAIPASNDHPADLAKNISKGPGVSVPTSRGPIKRGSGNSFLSKNAPPLDGPPPSAYSDEEFDMGSEDVNYDWDKKK